MSGSKLYVNAHGNMHHFIALCMATKICYERGYKILDGDWFKKKEYYKGDPDLYIEKEDKIKIEGKRSTVKQRYVIEIETSPTNESIEKKNKQFHETVAGHDLIICDLRKCNTDNVTDMWRYLNERIP